MARPTKITFIYDNPIDDARILTASSEVPSMPASRLRTMPPGDIYQSIVCNNVVINFTLTRPVCPDFFGMVNHGMDSGSARLQLDTTNSFLAPPIDITYSFGKPCLSAPQDIEFGELGFGGCAEDPYAAFLKHTSGEIFGAFFTAPQDAMMYGRVTFTSPYNRNRAIKLGRLYCVKSLTFARNYCWQSTCDMIDMSLTSKSQYGSYIGSDERGKLLRRSLKISHLGALQRFNELMDLWLRVGTGKPFLCILDPGTDAGLQRSISYCHFVEDPRITDVFVDDHDLTLTIEDAI